MLIFTCVARVVEIVNAVYLPLVEEADFDGVLLAKEGTTHAHYAILSKM